MQQRTPEWYKARRGKLTASRLSAAAGVCPYMSRNKYLEELKGEGTFTGNSATSWGTANEPNAIRDYVARTGNLVQPFGFKLHKDHSWIGGSPDGLVGERGMIEVKCPFYRMQPHPRVPAYYLCQVNALLEIFDRDWCDFISWTYKGFKIYRVYRDPALWDALLSRYVNFHACMLADAKMPNQAAGERLETLERLRQSDETAIDYHFWPDCETRMTPYNDPDDEPEPLIVKGRPVPRWVHEASEDTVRYWFCTPHDDKDQRRLTDYLTVQ